MGEAKTYEGSCHCGAVKFEVTMAPPEKVFDCNCSLCGRTGWLLAFVPAETFRLLAGEDATRDYQFAKKKLHHPFCTTCGVRAFSRGAGHDGKETVAVNLRCIPGLDLGGVPVQHFDGAAL